MSDPVTRLNAALSGRYKIEGQLGEGGMATVYLAEDLKHNRNVALKVLRPELAAVVGADRFLAEIKTTANLQHPHILPLFDSGEADSFLFYVMPYVEGESLRERLDREHQLPVDEAVQIATNVAEALDYAHAHGVIHRDIKPANILLQAGKPLLSDFGIALAVGAAGGGRLTETGLSLGTPHYMSPEQATGDLSVGPATDIYALGCVLYETLVAEPPYTGGTPQAILGKIVTGDADPVTKHRRSVPANVDAAVRKALEKVPADRFAGARDFASALKDPAFRHGALAAGSSADGAGPWKRVAVGLGALAAALSLGLVGVLLRQDPPAPVLRFRVAFEPGQEMIGAYASITPDGSALVYAGPAESGEGTQLWMRGWDDLEATPIGGTEGSDYGAISPDGRELAFRTGGDALRVVPIGGGPSRTLLDDVDGVSHWSFDGHVYYWRAGVVERIPVGGGLGGSAEALTEAREGDFVHILASVLPGGRVMIYQALRSPSGEGAEIRALDLESGDSWLVTAGNNPKYARGHLLFGTSEGTLMAVPMDPSTGQLEGDARVVAEGLTQGPYGVVGYAVSESGALIYADWPSARSEPGAEVEPLWVSREGEEEVVDPDWRFVAGVGTGGSYGWRLSPDGTRAVVTRVVNANRDIWVKQLPGGPFERLTLTVDAEESPSWSPDGRSIVYGRGPTAASLSLWQSRADGTGSPEMLLAGFPSLLQGRWSPDGDWLVFRTTAGRVDIGAFRPGVDTAATMLLATDFEERGPALSADGRWLAYSSDESGREEVYVRPFPDIGSGRVQVSTAGGANPVWAHGSDELFFIDAGRRMNVARVDASSTLRVTSREALFTLRPEYVGFAVGDGGDDLYDVSQDDRRFLMGRLVGGGGVAGTDVVERQPVFVSDWLEDVRRRALR